MATAPYAVSALRTGRYADDRYAVVVELVRKLLGHWPDLQCAVPMNRMRIEVMDGGTSPRVTRTSATTQRRCLTGKDASLAPGSVGLGSVPCFITATSMGSSAALTVNQLIVYQGSGDPPIAHWWTCTAVSRVFISLGRNLRPPMARLHSLHWTQPLGHGTGSQLR
jgi:hypothetical protein